MQRGEATGHERIIVALDVPTLDEALDLARALDGEVGMFKVGLELFGAEGPRAVAAIAEHGPVFLDLKLHDIPTTVERAANRLGALGVSLLTIHATGGPAMVAGAVRGMGDNGTILAVTVLTSMSTADLAATNQPDADVQVPSLAAMATEAGARGLVCAPPDVPRVRTVVPASTLVVTPGVRPAGSSANDQQRVATPEQAIADGADLLVIGRPITRADDPTTAARRIAATLS